MGTLTDRINRRQTEVTPIIERRGGTEQRIPEWRRRAQEQVEQIGYVAVTDLTRKIAA